MTRVTLTVPDIDCEHCEHTINEALSPVDGVRSVQVDIPAHLVKLEFDESKITIDQVKEILKEEDYPVAAVS
jgi:copper chaperone